MERKVTALRERQEFMKKVNAWYKKNGTLEGCPYLNEDQIREINESMERCDWYPEKRPFQRYDLTNNGQNLRKCKKRIEELKKAKEAEPQEKEGENGLYKLIENTDIMRIQFEFDGKPSDKIRAILKAHGFRWSPKQARWQRQLNGNGKYAAQKVAEETGASISVSSDESCLEGADVIYTDIWASMGEEDQIPERVRLLTPFKVTREFLDKTGNPDVIFMHCLPSFHDFDTTMAKDQKELGYDIREVTDEVFLSKNSVVFDEAENRMHTIKAVIVATIA